jgi:branched-chain amino acid transport system ATP-binding protein
MLHLQNLSKSFGGLRAIRNLSVKVKQNDFLGIIGPNGAGKTTLLNLITGYQKLDAGEIFLDDKQIQGSRPFAICRMGIGRTFQVVRPFAEMSVEENVMTGALFSSPRYVSVDEGRERAAVHLKQAGLWHKRASLAGTLTLGEKKKLELARALATRPRILLVDEVMGGLTRSDVDELVVVLREIHASGMTIVMIEHVLEAIVQLAAHIVVLNFGEKLFEGSPNDVFRHPSVIEAYLGRPLRTKAAVAPL